MEAVRRGEALGGLEEILPVEGEVAGGTGDDLGTVGRAHRRGLREVTGILHGPGILAELGIGENLLAEGLGDHRGLGIEVELGGKLKSPVAASGTA